MIKQLLPRKRTIFFVSVSVLMFQYSQSHVFGTSVTEKTIPSLKTIPIPGPSEAMLAELIVNKKVAIQLGKALYWDVKVGSDNKTACATCHFHAGTDNRVKNQMNPNQLVKDPSFDLPGAGPNYILSDKDFPLTIFPPEEDEVNGEGPTSHYNDIVGSQGVFNRNFTYVSSNGEADECETEFDPDFHVGQRYEINTRRNEQRNTPTVINAVFNFRNFWDGRANNVFNGVDPFGLRNESSYVWKYKDGKLKKVTLNIPSSSLASQASGPPLSGFEMSCKGRLFYHIGKKLMNQEILSRQTISKTDSELAEYAHNRPTYSAMIKKAFRKEYWSGEIVPYAGSQVGSMDLVDPPNLEKHAKHDGVPQIQANFGLFYGMALQMYMATLVSDDSPFDRYASGDTHALTLKQKRGLEVFNNKGKCITCHSGSEFTSASYSNVSKHRLTSTLINGKNVITDTGFFNIGVTPTKEDLGLGDKDPFKRHFSETMIVKNKLEHLLGNDFDSSKNPSPSDIKVTGIDGAFKVPSLRNVELTGPYFHNGGKSTLIQVVELYDRGGDFQTLNHPISALEFTSEEESDLVSFLLSLTDERVRYKRAPFDHPSLCFPHGHHGNTKKVFEDGYTGNATDIMECIPAVGAAGVSHRNRLRPFLNLDPFDRGPNGEDDSEDDDDEE